MRSFNVDSTVHEPGGEGLLTARQAATMLGVKVQTLYAYASRGLLQSLGGARSQGRLYRREDVERLKARHDARAGHGAVAAGALLWGEPVLDSAITGLDERGPRYRGHPATELVEAGVSFEEAAELLWTGTRPGARPSWPAPPAKLVALTKDVARAEHPIEGWLLLLPRLALADDGRHVTRAAAELERTRRLLPLLASAFRGREGGGRVDAQAAFAQRVADTLGVRPSKASLRALDAALVLTADHELNPSAFAARVAASAGADLYASLMAALATASGPRHAAATLRVEAMLAAVGDESQARAFVAERARLGETIPGFHHPLYPDGDPRAKVLLGLAEELGGSRRTVRTVLAVAQAMGRAGLEAPTLDLGLVAVMAALGAPAGAAAFVFVLGRAAGWVAHVLEQRESPAVLRPRARYVGP